ncbi:hypothetical protein UlMin_007024 [Ulmus minor]
MGYTCNFCREQRSMVYYRSDAACLCLSCGRNVHYANILSKLCSRTLICERCNSQLVFVRCVEERVSLSHKRQSISCYSGCPSTAELSSIWSFVLDFPSAGESACEEEMGLISIHENSTGNSQTPENPSGSIGLNDSLGKGKATSDLPAGLANATLPKVHDELHFYPLKLPGIFCFAPRVCNSNYVKYVIFTKKNMIIRKYCGSFYITLYYCDHKFLHHRFLPQY